MFENNGKQAKYLFIILSIPKRLKGTRIFLSILTVSKLDPFKKLKISDGVSSVELILGIFNLISDAKFNKGVHKGE